MRDGKDAIEEVFCKDDFVLHTKADERVKRGELRHLIQRNTLDSELKRGLDIMEPFCKMILKYESNKHPLSEIYHDFTELIKLFSTFGAKKGFSDEEVETILRICRDRWNFLYCDGQGIAYLLDPRYCGEQLNNDDMGKVEDYLLDYFTSNANQKTDMSAQILDYRAHCETIKERRGKEYFDNISSTKALCKWWLTTGKTWPLLQDVAFRVFSIPSSAAASERNWSAYGFIHSALRNRLKDERASKLVYVFFNTKGLNQIEAEEEDFADCESDEDEY